MIEDLSHYSRPITDFVHLPATAADWRRVRLTDGQGAFFHAHGVVAWHQDYSYWTRTRPMAHLTCWIGLDDATRDNGCLHYVPGSHRWELLPVTGLASDMDAIQTVLSPEQRAQFKPVAIELKKG